MGLIKDIRLFEADWPNEDYFSTPHYIGKIFRYDFMDALDVVERLVFLLRSRGFGFDGFDHLYLNYTTMLPRGKIQLSKRSVCREDAWLRWIDIGCDAEAFNSMDVPQKTEFIVSSIKSTVILMAPEQDKKLAEGCIREVMEKGERLTIPYKQKRNGEYTVYILVRITDELDYVPVIRISTKDGNAVFEKELKAYGRDAFICQFSSISIGKHSLRISPRKNYESEYYELKPVKLTW